MNRRKIDVGLSAILMTISTIILTRDDLAEGGMETELGSMFLPRVIAVFIILFSGTLGAQALLALKKGSPLKACEHIDTAGFLGVGIYFGIFTFYWLIVPYLGFMVATPFIVFAIAYLLGGRRWIPMTALSVLTPVFIYYGCSQYLRVFLPTGSIF